MRPGVKTTEFWTTIFTAAYFILNATGALSSIPPNTSAIGLAAVSALYTLSRGWAKSQQQDEGNPNLFGVAWRGERRRRDDVYP